MADRSGGISHADGGTFEVGYTGSFSLAASIRFLEGFTPAGYETSPPKHLDLAFCAGPLWHPVAVRVAERAGKVIGSFVGDVSPEAVASNVARILSFHVDAREFPDVGQRDDVVAGLQAKYPGLRPVCFWTPYEAACWAVIGHRIHMIQAAAVKAKMAQQLGHAMVLAGTTLFSFPSPQRLVDLEGFPGLSGRKSEWLRGIARAALDGRLDPEALRALPRSEAIDQLRELGGMSLEQIGALEVGHDVTYDRCPVGQLLERAFAVMPADERLALMDAVDALLRADDVAGGSLPTLPTHHQPSGRGKEPI